MFPALIHESIFSNDGDVGVYQTLLHSAVRDQCYIDFSSLEFDQEIGRVASSTVWSGALFGHKQGFRGGMTPAVDVAIKVISPNVFFSGDPKDFARFARACFKEVEFCTTLRHPNIVGFLGFCFYPPSVSFVFDLCNDGDLTAQLKNRRAHHAWTRCRLQWAGYCGSPRVFAQARRGAPGSKARQRPCKPHIVTHRARRVQPAYDAHGFRDFSVDCGSKCGQAREQFVRRGLGRVSCCVNRRICAFSYYAIDAVPFRHILVHTMRDNGVRCPRAAIQYQYAYHGV